MSEELHKLQRIGAQKIYEQTHIPIQHIQEILQSDFSSFSRVQFLGFISILEREYDEDLSSHKAFGMSYFDELEKQSSNSLSVSPEEKKSKKPIYIAVAVLLFLLVVIVQISRGGDQESREVDDTLINNVEESIIQPAALKEANLSEELNSTTTPKQETPKESKKLVKSFKIKAKTKVWFGYIDILTNKKKQTIFKGEFDLDPTKEWLLVFGHGYIDMYIDGKLIKFDSRNYIRFIYKDGELHTISKAEFKKLNRGNTW